MKTSAIILAAVATIVAAQSVEELVAQIPACVLPCIVKGAEAAGCKQGDHVCECDKMEEISSSVALCIVGLPTDQQCANVDDVQKATELSDKICKAVASGGSGTPTGASSSSTGSSSATTTKAPEATETGEDDSSSSSSKSSPSSSSSAAASASSTPGAANKVGFAWAGAAAALAAAAL